MYITKDFTLEELTNSSTATKYGIDNRPNEEEQQNLMQLVYKILQPIRDKYNKPIVVSSGYRCTKLNNIVGGSKSSQHLLGEAADIHSVSDSKKDNKELYQLIVQMIDDGKISVGQLINEYNYDWIHISLPNWKHTNQVFSID